MTGLPSFLRPMAALALGAALVLSGCESMNLTKRIDYKSTASGPALELPPDLTTPRYDDRYTVTSANALAAAQAGGTQRKSELLLAVPDARIARAGNERWLVVKTTPENAWGTTRQFWNESGFVLASEQPALGLMETDWAENRAEIPQDFMRRTIGQFADVFFTTYKRDKFRTRIERGSDQGDRIGPSAERQIEDGVIAIHRHPGRARHRVRAREQHLICRGEGVDAVVRDHAGSHRHHGEVGNHD